MSTNARYLQVETEDPTFKGFYQEKLSQFEKALSRMEHGARVITELKQQEETIRYWLLSSVNTLGG
jgi:hypothetical protein